jgi:type I restriction enzyme R subunit
VTRIIESHLEQVVIQWFESLGYAYLPGPDIEPETSHSEREDYAQVLLIDRLREALYRINPDLPSDAIEDALLKIKRSDSPSLYEDNRLFHQKLVDGVDVEYQGNEGRIIGDKVQIVDFSEPENNDWLVVNQFTVMENKNHRRPDVVIFVNGIPLAVIELKNPADENATIKGAYNQLQTYKNEIPTLFRTNEILVISDGIEARCGTLTAIWERFMPWRTIDGKDVAPKGSLELETLIKGIFDKSRFLDLIRYFIVFHKDQSSIIKIMAGYHQYHAANKAVECTLEAASTEGDQRIGVIWHTQGSGKSLTMAFYAGKIIQQETMQNPTLVILTDRNDLDDQLFSTFSASHELLRQTPSQADSREKLKEILSVASGGVIFTTIQKFFPEGDQKKHPLLSDRKNIVFIVDEAHRSQYDFIDGYARHMRDALPNASFIGFTGTPIELSDKNTRAVFGDYIDVYDIQRAVEDQATVKIYYEGRLARIDLDDEEKDLLDEEFNEITEGEEQGTQEKLKSRWARLEALVGTDKRIHLIAEDLISHFEKRLETLDGKGMIVCMSRRICIDLYKAIVELRPEWHDERDDKGFIKVVMTGSASDPEEYQKHVRTKGKRHELAKRFKNSNDPLKLVIVRDMWLTGFDVPCLHTMYIDKPMHGHGLMQAIARVNRVFKDKPGGLVVDYIGIADQLKKALRHYSEQDREDTGIPQEEAVAVMLEKYEIVKNMFHGFDYSSYFSDQMEERIKIIPKAMEHILSQEDGKTRYLKHVNELSRAFALSVPHPAALQIRDEVGFFQTIRASLSKVTTEGGKSKEDLDTAIRQLVSEAVAADGVLDIFAAAGLDKPEISILSDEFLEEVRHLPHKNLAFELLKKLINDEIQTRSRKNVVQARSFAEMLEKTIRLYQNRSIQTAELINELIEMAKDLREQHKRGEQLGLTEDELAFYDALEVNDSAVKVLGDEVLKKIAHELVDNVRRNVSIDWTVKESARARLRVLVKRILRKHGYPPDKEETATITVLEQAEVLCNEWAA